MSVANCLVNSRGSKKTIFLLLSAGSVLLLILTVHSFGGWPKPKVFSTWSVYPLGNKRNLREKVEPVRHSNKTTFTPRIMLANSPVSLTQKIATQSTKTNSEKNEMKGVRKDYNKERARLYHVLNARSPVKQVKCSALIQDDADEQRRVRDLMLNRPRISLSGQDYIKLTSDCTHFKLFRGYITDHLSTEEMNFPIAFSIIMYKDIEQTERLLRAIYQPQNYYCIHVDGKSEDSIKNGMKAVAKCFDNVFLVEKPVAVVWGKFTVLEAELLCMKELWAYQKWKYFINLTGQEFPLKTNFELVKILKAYNGSNNLEGTRESANKDRWIQAGPPPHGIIPTKGSVHIAASRGFVGFLLKNQIALDFLEWVKKTSIPDETFFSTLNHNPHLGVPGSYKGRPETDLTSYHFLTRYKIWDGGMFSRPCKGKYHNSICIFGTDDLPSLTLQPHLFANKFHWDFQPYAWDCLEEWHFNKTRDGFLHKTDFDVSYYKTLSFVKNKVI
ncbi:beta-1,3-galactosyl-O-glycosyl-glycoprotein beta-1,6-N-acetylglucosaminyltransferase-like [Liolophura sinensis]|uniref:beta-1,3-galactosyl-O-glycosyl-glycoprotein beta-1,6-N-acetylglucosaminyltransferase-like n=1 Tax=Liolophura sinensis TaxID=3198878 RepID=UPI003158386E